MRTWTLRGWYEGEEREKDYVSAGPKIGPRGPVQVIELEPVLDLLEKLQRFGSEPFGHGRYAYEATTALLRAHGRLDG